MGKPGRSDAAAAPFGACRLLSLLQRRNGPWTLLAPETKNSLSTLGGKVVMSCRMFGMRTPDRLSFVFALFFCKYIFFIYIFEALVNCHVYLVLISRQKMDFI